MVGYLYSIMLFSKKAQTISVIPWPGDDMLDQSIKDKTIILVPVGSHIEPACDEVLRQLEKEGIKVYRKYGFSAIDQGRCVMAQQAINDGYEHLFWIDSDIAFHISDIYKVINTSIREKQPFITGTYCVKGWPALTTKFHKDFDEIVFGNHGGLYEVEYAATGFMYTHVSVYEKIKLKFDLKPVNIWGGQYKVHAWFLPMIIDDNYVGEDFSFCYRAKKSGITIFADTTIRLAHIGRYSYSFDFINRGVVDEPSTIVFKNE